MSTIGLDVYSAKTTQKSNTEFYDFGVVAPGSVSTKNIKIRNECSMTQIYEVRRDPSTNPLDYVFTVEPDVLMLCPSHTSTFKLTYAPTLPSTITVDYFNIVSRGELCLKFGAQGSCLGPSLKLSAKNLFFLSPKIGVPVFQKIEIFNESDTVATYQFQWDKHHGIFKLDCTNGKVDPNAHTYVTITFIPPSAGVYTKRIFCLVLNQGPVVIDALGICTPRHHLKRSSLQILRYPQSELKDSGYKGYLRESIQFTDHIPPLGFTTNNLDFSLPTCKCSEVPLSFSVTNHSRFHFLLQWIQGVRGPFNIKPKSVAIRPNCSVMFEAFFKSELDDTLYAAEMDGMVYWSDSPVTTITDDIGTGPIRIPITCSLNLIGHSFHRDSFGWMPQYRIWPKRIIMPACVPRMAVNTTFVLERSGFLPLMFKLVSPPQSKIVIKPMQGVIEEDFQLFVAQFYCDQTIKGAHVEIWTIYFNGSEFHKICLEIRAFVENPVVQIGNQYQVDFPMLYLKCLHNIYVPLKNKTRHCIRYRYSPETFSSALKVIDSEGTVAPNEIVYHKWQFCPDKLGAHKANVECTTVALQDSLFPVGIPLTTCVTAQGYCESMKLIALPAILVLGPVLYQQAFSKVFSIFNLGKCKAHFILRCKSNNKNVPDSKVQVCLTPTKSTINPGENQEIEVQIVPNQMGHNNFSVMCDLRVSRNSDVTVKNESSIINIKYQSVCSRLRITDLIYHNAPHYIGKVTLWEMMAIDRWNLALHSVLPSHYQTVTFHMPQAQKGNEPMDVYLLVHNQSEFGTEWNLTRQKECSCELIQKTKGMSVRYMEFECPHRPLFTISPTEGTLEGKASTVLTLRVQYSYEGLHKLSYILNMTSDRHVKLTALIGVIQSTELDQTVQKISMQHNFIGDIDPISEPVWVYNTTKSWLNYEVKTSQLECSSEVDIAPNFECLNPVGQVMGNSMHPLLFKCAPTSTANFHTTVEVTLGERQSEIKLQARGVGKLEPAKFARFYRIPQMPQFLHPEMPVVLSQNHIIIKNMLTFSQVNRLFFIKNTSLTSILGYVWMRHYISGVLSAKICPAKGTLQPGESHECRLVLRTRGTPCFLTFGMCCELLNMTERRQHEKAAKTKQTLEKIREGEFTITEFGTTYPKIEVEVPKMPVITSQTLDISCCILSHVNVDGKFSLQSQLKHTPPIEYIISNEQHKVKLKAQQVELFKEIFEMIIWDIVHGKLFTHVLSGLKNEGTPYYSQFCMDAKTRLQLTNDSFYKPSRYLLESLFNSLILETLHEAFGLGPVRKDLTAFDIRFAAQRASVVRKEAMETLYRSFFEDPTHHGFPVDSIKYIKVPLAL